MVAALSRYATRVPPLPSPLGIGRAALAAAYAAGGVAYFAWRVSTLSWAHPLFSLVLLAAEAGGAAALLLHVFVTRHLSRRAPPEAPPGLPVDVFVTAGDEPVALLRRTLLAARSMDYPHQTWLLDDGHRAELRELARELRVRYAARPLDTGSRAGSLNHALRYSQAAFVAVFEAHDAPARGFLTETLGYFRDARVAFVQTPLDAYNLDSFAHRAGRRGRMVWSDLAVFSRVVQRGNDRLGAAQLCGSCAVLRRAALDDIGGFAPATIAADLHTSLRLHKAGWRSVYHAHPVAFGHAPTRVEPFVAGHLRRCQGVMQVWRRERVLLSARLSGSQKAAYLHTVLGCFSGWPRAVYYLSPVVVLTTGALPFAAPVAQFVAAFVAFHVLGLWLRTEAGRGYANVLREEQYHMARFAASIAATLTPAPRARRPSPAPRRAAQVWPFVLPQAALLFAAAVAMPAGVALHARGGVLPHDALVAAALAAALTGALAASVIWFSARVAAYRRRDYRFRVPVPARLRFPKEGPRLGIFDDVSSEGFRFYGPFPPRVGVGARFAGDLFLPSGKLAFAAVVRAEYTAPGDAHVKGIGCSFEWPSAAGRDALERYLYGTDLQWAVNDLADRQPTPLERAARLLRRTPDDAASPHWAPVLYQHAANTFSPPHVGVVSLPAGDGSDRRLATVEPLDPKRPVRLRIVTRTGSRAIEGRPVAVRQVETPANPVFIYRLAG